MPLKIIGGKLYGRWEKYEKKRGRIVRFHFGKGWGYRIEKRRDAKMVYLSLSRDERVLVKSLVGFYGEALLPKREGRENEVGK